MEQLNIDTAHLKTGDTVHASGSSLTSKNILSSPGVLRIRLRRVDFPSPASPMAAITNLLSVEKLLKSMEFHSKEYTFF